MEKKSETRLVKAIFPNTTNHYDTLFGGTALQWMDEIAFICATRYCHKRVVTVRSDKVDFKHPIPAGSIIELVAFVTKVGRTSLVVQVDMYREEMYKNERDHVIQGEFTFVAIDEQRRPIPVED